MKKTEFEKIKEKIEAGVKAAIAKLYADAKKFGWELVVSENGKIKRIKGQ